MSVIIATPSGVARRRTEDQREHQEVGEGHAGVEQQMLDTSSGMAMRFSWRYSPGAMKPQICWRMNGIARNSDTIMVSLNGVRNGEATSVAIIVALAGRCAQRRRDQGVDLLGEGEQPGEDQEDGGDAAQQAGAQLGQVRNQRHRLVVFRILAHGARGG
jgi:hypothetical protein